MTKRYVANITIEAQAPLKIGSNASSPIQKDWNDLPMILGTSITGVLRKEFDKTAVNDIFGHKKELTKDKKTELGQKGKILISDCFKTFDEEKSTKVFDHVSIDRFTGGAIDGALFQEKTVAADGDSYEIEILLHVSVEGKELEAFEAALKDIATGMLPLGGATTKGHGVFQTALENGVPYVKS